MGINIARRDAEWMLVAGMLSTVPAIIINSVLTPVLITPFGLDATAVGTLGEGIVLFVSAPVGEELCKGLAVLALSRLILSPKHGFYVGSTVGLGFALLENAQYIFMALLGEYSSVTYLFTAVLRGISSIPGHAMWTGLTGYALGCWLQRKKGQNAAGERSYLSEKANANWILYDKNGTPVSMSSWSTVPSDRMVRLLMRHQGHAWPMPTNLGVGLGLAMLGHALWNGSSWGVSMLLSDNESGLAIALQLAWLIVMVVALWVCILRCLPTIVLGSATGKSRS
jgi:RsiW-degrading membrane proteinase PrsW (M82 family)